MDFGDVKSALIQNEIKEVEQEPVSFSLIEKQLDDEITSTIDEAVDNVFIVTRPTLHLGTHIVHEELLKLKKKYEID